MKPLTLTISGILLIPGLFSYPAESIILTLLWHGAVLISGYKSGA